MGGLDGRVAVITGAASGLGFAVATRMVAEGAAVVIGDIDGDAGERAAAELQAGGGRALAVRTDVSVEDDVAALMGAAVAEFGTVDILHNNAAALGADTYMRDEGIEDMDAGVWDRTMAVNLRGAMFGCKYAVPIMRAQRRGAIVSTSSLSAFVGETSGLAYACSKTALGALTRHVANMVGADGIRINAVAPGLMMTPPVRERLDERRLAAFRCERLMEHATKPEDVANLIVFLASDQAACITGQVYVIDGGTQVKRPRRAMADWEAFLATEAG